MLPGEEAAAPVNTVHRWANQGSSTVRALAQITPASEGFEKGLPILYGLAGDGVSTSRGVPRDPLVAAWIMELTDMRLPGVSRVAGPVIHALPRQPASELRQQSPPRRPSRRGPDRGAPRRFPAPSHR